MKKRLKGVYLIISSLVIAILHLPFAFAKAPARLASSIRINTPTDSSSVIRYTKSIYDSLHLELSGLSKKAFDCAQKGWAKLVKEGRLLNESVIAIIDFSQPSDRKRLFILDMDNYKVLYNTLVAHGKNSGKEWATSFSNQPSSYKSSPGFYITGDTYNGNNGYSLKLEGTESGINDKALKRAIVMHGARYVDESYIESQGYIGRSEGCPAVPLKDANYVIDAIRNGACLFIYSPDQRYLNRSSILHD